MSVTTNYTGGRLSVTAGRVTEIDVGATVVDVLTDPAGGNVTVNPDGTLGLILPDQTQRGDTSFRVLVKDGATTREMTVELSLKAGDQDAGWGSGEHYTLEVGDDDRSVVEAGENHRKVYITESKSALGIAEIAAREGVSRAAIDGEWLAAHPEYGASQNLALDTEAGMMLWYEITGTKTDASSNHLLFEAGHRYEGTGRLVTGGTHGESALHPVLVGSWGLGDRPVLEDGFSLYGGVSENVVIRGIDFVNGQVTVLGGGKTVLLEDLVLRDHTSQFRGAETLTLRNSQIINSIGQGLLVVKSDGILIEGVLADHNGWEDGWETGDGVEPDMFKHNIYIQWDNLDVTFRDNVSMRGSSFGAQIRSGGMVENNAFLDNNIGFNLIGGQYRNGEYVGNYSNVFDNVVSSGAHKESPNSGALAWGVQNLAHGTSFTDNIIAHLADPADPAERAEKTEAPNEPLKHKFAPFFDDTIVYNWITDAKRDSKNHEGYSNVPNIAAAILDEVTLRRFVQNELGVSKPGDVIDTLATWLRANWNDGASAEDVVSFFQGGFGIEREVGGGARTVRFAPDARGDGLRADNRLNWTGEELPRDGDSLDLAGNWVTWSGTLGVKALDLGAGGELIVRQGRLDIAALETGTDSKIAIGLAGQLWTKGYGGGETLGVEVTGGRFANTGTFSGPADLAVSAGEVLLATAGATFELDGRLAIEGSAAKVGFDGQGGGAATLSLMPGAELFFAPDAGGISTLREVRSGSWGLADPNVASRIDLGHGDTTLSLDLGAVSGKSAQMTLAEVDTLTGGFGNLAITGAGGTRVTVTIDYGTDQLELATAAGSGTTLVLSGSGDADFFVVAGGVAARIEKYASQDMIDLSAVLNPGNLGDLALVDAGSVLNLVRESSGAVLAGIGSVTGDQIRVRADGAQVSLDIAGGWTGEDPDDDDDDDDDDPDPDPVTGPLVARDDRASVSGLDERIYVLANDEDPDGTAVWVASFSPGQNGSVKPGGGGRLIYTPDKGFTGTDSFTYTAIDEDGDTDTATVTVTVPPGSGGGGDPGPRPDGGLIARDDTASVSGPDERIYVLANDEDPDGTYVSIASFSQGGHGSVKPGGGGRLIYTPDKGFTGTDSFTYTAIDLDGDTATATVTVDVGGDDDGGSDGGEGPTPDTGGLIARNDSGTVVGPDARIHVLGNDEDPYGTHVSIDGFSQGKNGSVERGGGGRLTYTPDKGFTGTDSFTYTAIDLDGDTATATVTVAVPPGSGGGTPVPRSGGSLIARDDSATVSGPDARVHVLANDEDPDGTFIWIASFSQGKNGSVELGGGGRLTYTPAKGFTGTDSFTYTAIDEDGDTDTATVTIDADWVF